jgi:hypothetical protein
VNAGISKLRGIRKETDKGYFILCFGREDAKHILLNVRKQKERTEFFVKIA